MSLDRRQKNRRDKLFEQHPYCFWCGCELVHPKDVVQRHKPTSPNMATLDHLRHKRSKNRQQLNTNGKRRTVLACHECNMGRANNAVKKLSKWRLWNYSKRTPIEVMGIRMPTDATF